MRYELRPLTAEQGESMATWAYPGPWAVYDVGSPLDPDEGFWAVVEVAVEGGKSVESEQGGKVVGYACFGVEARVPGLAERDGVLDIGVGMRPDLTGRGPAVGAGVRGDRGAPRGGAALRGVRALRRRRTRLVVIL